MINFPNLWRTDRRGGAGFEKRRKDSLRRHDGGSCKSQQWGLQLIVMEVERSGCISDLFWGLTLLLIFCSWVLPDPCHGIGVNYQDWIQFRSKVFFFKSGEAGAWNFQCRPCQIGHVRGGYIGILSSGRGWSSRRSAQAQACPSWPQTHREGKRSGAGLRPTS